MGGLGRKIGIDLGCWTVQWAGYLSEFFVGKTSKIAIEYLQSLIAVFDIYMAVNDLIY